MFLTFSGIDSNETIKVYRSGGADPDGDQPGDLYVTIKVLQQLGSRYFFVDTFKLDIFICLSFLQVREDPVFRREGSDIHVDAVLSITQVMIFDEENLQQCFMQLFGSVFL